MGFLDIRPASGSATPRPVDLVRWSVIGALLLLVPGPAAGASVSPVPAKDAAVLVPVAEKRRVKTIIVDNYRPYTFLNDRGEPDGFSVEILQAVARTLGLEVEIRSDTWEHATRDLETGAIDVLPMMAYSAEREKIFDFSAPHTIAYDSVFVRKGGAGPRSLEELAGKTVVVLNKDVAHQYLVEHGLDKTLKLVLVESLPAGLHLLDAGKADAAIMPKLVGLVLAKALRLDANLQSSPLIDRYDRPFSFAVREGNDQLLSSLNYGLSLIRTTGQYNQIYKKWFATLEDPHIELKTALTYAAAAAAVFLALLAWTLALRRQVRTRTQHLAASQKLLQDIADNSGSLVYALDDQGRFLLINRSLESVLGVPRETLIGKTRAAVLPPEIAAAHRENDLRVFAERRPVTFEEENEQTDGKHLYLSVKFPLLDGRGAPYGVGGVSTDITDRKRAEQTAASTTLRLKMALQAAQAGTWDWDVVSGRIEWSQEMFSIFGLDAQKDPASFASWRSTLHPEDRELAERRISDALAQRTVLDSDYRVLLPDGQVRWINAVGEGVYDDQGRPVQMIGICLDITERKRIEEELRRTRSLLQAAMDQSPAGIAIADAPDGTLRYVNDAGLLIRGGDRATVVNGVGIDGYVASWKLLDFDGRPLRPDEVPLARAIMFGETCSREFIIRRDLADDRIVLANAAPVRNDAGQVVSAIVVFSDITESKRAEKALSESELRLRTLVRAIPDLVWLKDPEGVYLDCNASFERLFGVGRTKIIGKTDYDFFEREIADSFREHDRRAVAAGKPSSNEEWVTFADGGHRALLETIKTPMFDAAGALVGVLGIARDITERLRATEEKERLENLLRQSQKVEAIGRLAGGVAHDFNNITAIVVGYAEMLLGVLGPEDPARRWVEQIIEAGRRSAALTRQLLAFSRKQTLQPVVLDLNALLRNLEGMLSRVIGEDIELQFALSADRVFVTADPGQIEQVVTNLAINARDAMPFGGSLTVTTAVVELDETYARGRANVVPGRYVMLSLTDTGCGMDKATMDRLFEPFFTTKEKGKGTGLGLATAHGIVHQSGGQIWAYSEPGRGTTFKIYLPQTDAPAAAPTITPGGEVPRGRGELILLVEDEAPLRELCETILLRLGYRVSVAASGPEGLQRAQESMPDLVVTDVIMPGMSGAEMTQQLRRERPDLKILYMSGYPDDAIARHGVLDPGTNFVEKPFTERVLAAKVREALAK